MTVLSKSKIKELSKIPENAKILADRFLTPAPDYKPNNPGYICPKCGNGSGENGTGIHFIPNKDLLKCFKCGESFDLIKVIEITKNQSYNQAIEEIANKLGYKVKESYINDEKDFVYPTIESKERDLKEKQEKEKNQIWQKIRDYIYTDEESKGIFKKTKYKIIDKITGEILDKPSLYYDLINHEKDIKLLSDNQRFTLYNRLGIREARENNQTLYFVEGEKDVETLKSFGLIATTLKASQEKINKHHKEQVKGIKEVFILPDNDEPGYKCAYNLFNGLKDTVSKIKILEWPDVIPEKYDITDYIENNKLEAESTKDFIKENLRDEYPTKYLNILDDRLTSASREELYNLLKRKGIEWKNTHTINGQRPKKIPAHEMAMILKDNCYCTIIGASGQENAPMAIYQPFTGTYTTNIEYIDTLINSIDKVSKNKMVEVRYQLRLELIAENNYNQPYRGKKLTALGNGIFNHDTKKLEDFTPHKVFLSKVSTNYNPEAKVPKFDDWDFIKWIIDDIAPGDIEKLKLVWQIFAKVIRPNYNIKTSYFIYDDNTDTGKSTFLQLLKNLVGEENTETLNLAGIEARFSPASAEGKALIIGEDNDRRTYLDKSDNFKNITSGDPIFIEKKGQDGYSTQFNCTIVQSMNGIPKFGTIDQGLIRRIKILRFSKHYEKSKLNPRVKEEYIYNKDLLEYIVYHAIHHVDLSENIDTAESRELLYQLSVTGDPIMAFCEEVVEGLDTNKIPTKLLFKIFVNWSEYTQGIKNKYSQTSFTNRAKEYMNLNSWDMKKARLGTDFNIDNLEDVWHDILKDDIEGGAKENPHNNGLDLYINDYRQAIENNKAENCFVKVE